MPAMSLDTAAQCLVAGNHRIVVVGSTGSGKTTLARWLARRLNVTHVELDALHWDPNWTPAATPIFRERTVTALTSSTWVVDGNYSKVRDIVWTRADTLIWLDYPLPIILWRLSRRTFWRLLTRTELWNGNRERFREQFFSRDSIFLWALTRYRGRRREYPLLLAQPEHAHLTVVHLRTPRSTRRLLTAVMASSRQR
jgi:adenylate kinase family enzyme